MKISFKISRIRVEDLDCKRYLLDSHFRSTSKIQTNQDYFPNPDLQKVYLQKKGVLD